MTEFGRFTRAIVRRLSPDFACGLTTSAEGAPDFATAVEQHRAYCEALSALGVEVIDLEPLEGFPDAWFVEDTAIIGDGFAVVTRPGAMERLGEEAAMASVLERTVPVEWIEAPGTVDGGDVLEIGDHYIIGVSDRTNEEGAAQLGRLLEGHGKSWQAMAVGSGLHLKSSLAALDEETLLAAPEYAGRRELAAWKSIVVPAEETYAANSIRVNGMVLTPAGYPRLLETLDTAGYRVAPLDVSEARKMDGGLSCMSLRIPAG